MRVSVNGAFVYVDYIIALVWGRGRREALLYSCFERSEMALRGFTANISLNNAVLYVDDGKDGRGNVYFPKTEVTSYHTKLIRGKEPINHSISISVSINKKYLLTSDKTRDKDIYNWLMVNFDYPLLKEWVPYLLEEGKERIKPVETEVYGDRPEWAANLLAYEVSLTEDGLAEMISNGLKSRRIKIAGKPQKQLTFDNMDDYFLKYGNSLIENLEKKLNPLVELKDTVDEIAFIEKRFYPQQAAIVNGLVECMRHGSYAFLNEDMGCGKTLQGMGVPEAFFNRMAMEHSHSTIKEIYMDPSAVKYRNIIMCPSHLVGKWEEAIKADIPYAKVTVIRNLKTLCRLKKKGSARTCKEFYILSKETGKLSYTYEPLPVQIKKRKAAYIACKKCGLPRPISLPEQCSCGGREWATKECGFSAKGLVCPECGKLLYTAEPDIYSPDGMKEPLMPSDFATQTKANRVCRHCGTLLWQPACEPVNRTLTFRPVRIQRKKWIKITHWANKAKKNKKTVWVHEKWKEAYIAEHELLEDEISYPGVAGVRKFALSRYIKKYLKGYFDFAIFDEAHEYKGGGSAQGLAMHDLVKASRWQLALTGTIAGGYASHFFYLLYRLDPVRMKAKGYNYSAEGERKFVERYGTIATEYEVEQKEDGSYNTMSRGRQIGSPKCRPGISPDIFTDFLLDHAVFLNLSDMSSYLPPLKENVESIPLEDEISCAYNLVRQKMKEAMMQEKLGQSLLGSYLQFSLSYTDKPYGKSDVLSPIDGRIIASVPDLSYLIDDGKLTNKERRLCEIVSQEMKEKRNVFIYCEYTGKGESNITHRLKEIIQRECGLRPKEVEILESSSPPAEEREAWMHERASKGVKVFITNPKCVKTGLDFLFWHKGVLYNFPTIVFFQYSYDLFTMWQASRRHYRLNQILECRTFFLLSERTIQLDALEMVASKQVATSAIQGHFSSEGLCAMAQGVDPRVKLAQAAAEKSPEQIKGLKSMFDVLNQWHLGSGEKKEYKKMLTFFELTGIDLKKDAGSDSRLVTDTGEAVDFFGLFGIGVAKEQEKQMTLQEEKEKKFEEEIMHKDIEEMKKEMPQTIQNELDESLTEQKQSSTAEETKCSLFGFFTEGEFPTVIHQTSEKPKKNRGMRRVINF